MPKGLIPRHSKKSVATGRKLQFQGTWIGLTIYLIKGECPDEPRGEWVTRRFFPLGEDRLFFFFSLDFLLCSASCLIPFKLCASSLAFWFNISPKGWEMLIWIVFQLLESWVAEVSFWKSLKSWPYIPISVWFEELSASDYGGRLICFLSRNRYLFRITPLT